MENKKVIGKVFGRLFSEKATYYSWDKERQFPRYDSIRETERTWDLCGEKLRDGRVVDSLKTAEMWLLENHPAFIQGANIEWGEDFSMGCVPCSEYEEGYFESYEGRLRYAKRLADRYGVTVGEETAEDVLRACHG